MTHDSHVLAALYAGEAPPAVDDASLDVFEAAALGRRGRVEELIAADPSRARAAAVDGFTALHLVAFFSGDAGIARLLLDVGADPSAVANNDMQVTPLN
nr:ankyrin repeat domain-containing protein [Thermoleophilaceae bacterium]